MKHLLNIWKACIILLITVSLLSSCSTKIASRPVSDELPNKGIVYHLPATELSYVLTFRLTDCRGAIEITDASVVQRLIPDRGTGTYLIDSASLGSLSKTIPLAKFSIENGMLTSISYDAKDKTADIVKSSATLLGQVVSGASPIKLPSLDGALSLLTGTRSMSQEQMIRSFQPKEWQKSGQTSPIGICNESTKNILDEYQLLQRHLSTMKRKLYETEEQLAEKRDGLPEKIKDMEDVIKKTKERLTELDRHLTLQYKKNLVVEAGKCESFGDIALESAPFAKWFSGGTDQEAFRKTFQAWIEDNRLSYTIGSCQGLAKVPERKLNGVVGLYYRIPAHCKLEITKDTLVSSTYVELMQCGRLAAVEITNGAFQDNSHRIEFDPLSGEIKSFEFKDNTVRATEATESAADAIKKVSP